MGTEAHAGPSSLNYGLCDGEIDARDSEAGGAWPCREQAPGRTERGTRHGRRAYFAESLNRLQRELQEQIDPIGGTRSASWRPEIEHLKITRLRSQARKSSASKRASPGD